MSFSHRFDELQKAFTSVVYSTRTEGVSQIQAIETAFSLLKAVKARGGIAYVIGNGGSAGIASHFCTDLMKALKIPSSTLYDSNLMTCLSNDYGYERVFSYPLEQILKSHDLLIAISSSGKSLNILGAVQVAVNLSTPVITFSGFSSQNPLRTLGDLNFWVENSEYGLVEMIHFFLLHTLVDHWNLQHPQVKEYARIFASQNGS